MPGKKRDSDDSQEEDPDREDQEKAAERQDLYVVFTSERELRSVEQVRIKISQFTGVVIRIKNVTTMVMENLLTAIEQDALNFQQAQALKSKEPASRLQKAIKTMPTFMQGLSDFAPVVTHAPTSGIQNLRFEECCFASKAIQVLKTFLSSKPLIETVCVQRVEFQSPVSDFRGFCEGLQFSNKVRKVAIINQVFDEEQYGKIISHLLNDCRALREFDCSQCEFYHPKCFFDMCQAYIGEKCRVQVFKCKGINISNLEGKVMQFVLMKNKSLHTLDFSNCKLDSPDHLEYFLQKIDKTSNIRYLVLDNIQPDLSGCLELMGTTFAESQKLEVLNMRENKLKWIPYSQFWENIQKNTSLLKINVSKTDLSDRVLEKLCLYLDNPAMKLVDLDLSRNSITDVGLQNLCDTLINNQTIKYLNLNGNLIRDVGLKNLVTWLSVPNCKLVGLSLAGNKINNEGIHIMSEFIRPNTSLQMLDISKNLFSDQSFAVFAQEMGIHATLTFLDISKSKELSDEGSLINLAKQLAFNSHLQTLELSGVRVRKPFLKLYLEPSLRQNITLKYVIGKMTPDVIDEQLEINIKIQTDVEPNFTPVVKGRQAGFDVHLVDPECNSKLNMTDASNDLFDAAFKFVQKVDVRQVDLSGMQLQDGQLYHLANYLQTMPNLRSLILDSNHQITDDGVCRIAQALSINNKLAHLSIQKCRHLTNESLEQLLQVITQDNMMLCSIEFDEGKQYKEETMAKVKREAQLNQWLQEHLKPQFIQPIDIKKKQMGLSTSEEVFFKDGAQIAKYLASAIKCWRITLPVIIQIENQGLTDRHIVELTEFLRDKNMITTLNLRRNRISNFGAMALIDWMLLHDKTLTSMDVSRNRITRAGAQAFLTALKKLTRIQEFQITYGNPIPLDLNLAIQQEILANQQIKQNESRLGASHQKIQLTPGRYELIDRGPLFMRCAIKSVELLKIQHLSLPDNMLGFEEAKMLAAMIELDPPLRTLNLETNNLDANCAKLIAEALGKNTNLLSLNLARNKLSDLGINYIIQTLIKARLNELDIEQTNEQPQQQTSEGENLSKAVIKESNMLQEQSSRVPLQDQQVKIEPSQTVQSIELTKTNKVQDERLLTEEIEKVAIGQLKVLNIFENLATLESYKAIKTLQDLNPNIIMYFDSPMKMALALRSHKLLQEQSVKYQKLALRDNDEIEDINSTSNKIMPFDPEGQDQENNLDQSLDMKEEPDSDEDENSKISREQCQRRLSKCKGCVAKITCYKPPHLKKARQNQNWFNSPSPQKQQQQQGITADLNKISFRKILIWRLHNQKNALLNFNLSERVRKYDSKGLQTTLSVLMVFNQVLLYIFTILPFFITEEIASLFMYCLVAYLLIFEIFVISMSMMYINVQLLNLYFWLKILSSWLKKAAILTIGLMCGIAVHQSNNMITIIIPILSCLAILLDQYKAMEQVFKSRIIDTHSVLPYMERSQKVTDACFYQGLSIVLRKSTLLPSKEAIDMAKGIEVDLNPDLMKPPVVGLIPRLWDKLKEIYTSNFIAKHLILIDFSLAIFVVFGFILNWLKFDQQALIIGVVLILDTISCLLEYTETEKGVPLEPMSVFAVSGQRMVVLGDAYTRVLNKERKETSPPQTESDQSLFDQEGEEVDFGQTRIGDNDEKFEADISVVKDRSKVFSPELGDAETINVD